MSNRYHAQRKHILNSLDSILLQLHCLSFFQSPSIIHLLLRIICQIICRELIPPLPLGGFLGVLVALNGPSIWTHAIYGAHEGRAIILDFVGLGYVPTKLQLLSLDLLILFLQFILTIVSFEICNFGEKREDNSTNNTPLPPWPLSGETMSLGASLSSQKGSVFPDDSLHYVLDIRLSSTLTRLRSVPSTARNHQNQNSLLPLPNTTSWTVPTEMTRFMRSGSVRSPAGGTAGGRESNNVPGSLDDAD
ncbi:hypothetical protein E1B28_000541 [Marasmius oreades]|uniref:DUF1746 domain-containing protein n=1 Tax=Marasmius oreades TaxID=181124 RepID=A0A9P7V1K2_9AGAR|nr:uncharacterized protein E1B28_000541 [Marasmius oreades]KAG7098619.1 hypothetical protein E1B28_000541 [Marasmius oreades]